MTSDVSLQEGTFGRRAVLRGRWSDDLARSFPDDEVVELELNMAKGWVGSDLSFLARLPFLEALAILDLRPSLKSIAAIHDLPRLRSLDVETYCRSEIRFAAFPLLESCGLRWRPRARSLFDCGTLKHLAVDYKGKDTAPFARLTRLETLSLMTSPVEDLSGLSALSRLRSLRLSGLRRLTSLRGLDGVAGLEEFELQGCRRVTSIEQIAGFSRLRKLFLIDCGEIESLAPIEALTNLEFVCFYGTTIILDGDMSPLTRLPNLSRLAFRNRRHYSHAREDFTAYSNPGQS